MSRGSTISTGRPFMESGPRFGLLSISVVGPPRPATIGVSTPVGWTVLILMLLSASSLASDRQMPTTPCLAAVYGPRNGRPLNPALELGAMVHPPPLCRRGAL